jgi:hypothetical protein
MPGRSPKPGLVRGVIDPRATMNHDDRRPLAHRHSVRHKLRAIDIDEQPNIAYRDEHGK